MKIAEVIMWDTTSHKAYEMNLLNDQDRFVVVPDHFPDLVGVVTAKRGHFARSDGWSGEEFRVFPEATPEDAWREFQENKEDV